MTKSRKSRKSAEALDYPGSASYVGRFAPSPTGPLHAGSLICALTSFFEARARGGQWLVRMEDLDPPREQAGAAHSILRSLEAHGLEADGPIIWQSERLPAYNEVIEGLIERDQAYYCDCSRKMLAAQGGRYNGHCRHRDLGPSPDHAVRVRLEGDTLIQVNDHLQQSLKVQLLDDPGDFIIRRRDQLTAYQLAVVVDDAWQGITDILRGSDLYDSTPRQVYLQRVLELPTPRYTHIPVLTNKAGHKLSKQTHAAGLENAEAPTNLRKALVFLRQAAPPDSAGSVEAILDWALAHWQLESVPAVKQIPETAPG